MSMDAKVAHSVQIEAVVIRADGSTEDLGVVSYWHRRWWRRAWWSLTQRRKEH